MKIYSKLKRFTEVMGVSGSEGAVRELAREMISPFVDEVREDALGNLIAVKKAKAESAEGSLMFCAHLDEIGFIVTFIEENGYIRVAPVGGINPVAAAYSGVASSRGVRGIMCAVENEDKKAPRCEDLYIDIGAASKKEAEKKISIGDRFALCGSLSHLSGRRVCGRPIDDRVGCAMMVELAEQLANYENKANIYYVFTSQEEVGCRGAGSAAFGIEPEYCICFDVTATGDSLGARPMALKVGGGAAIKIKDSSLICSEWVVDTLCGIAKDKKIKHQLEILTFGGTDTSAVQLTRSGCRAGALSIPARNIHTGVELCDIGDTEACVALAEAFARLVC